MAPLGGPFGATSEWKRDISRAPLAPRSQTLVSNLSAQVADHWGGVAAFNVNNYNVVTYTVPKGTPRADVIWDNCQNKSYRPAQLYDLARGAHFAQVPIPTDAVPAAGSDGELSVYDPTSDQLWEFWKARKAADGWHACWGGRIDRVSTSPGYFNDGMGVTASGLSAVGGNVGIREMEAGRIDHALSLNVIDAAHWSEFSYPAQRSDGAEPRGSTTAIREGQRFRLDPAVDLNSLKLTPIARAVAVAAQKYGFIVNDKGGAVAVIAESGAGVAAKTSIDPWVALRQGAPGYAIMKNFPWSKLQALPMDYGK